MLSRNSADPITVVTSSAATGIRWRELSRDRPRDPGSAPSRAYDQMTRDADVCRARKLARKPITNSSSTGLAMPAPSCERSVDVTGSASAPLVTAAMFGMARMIARLAYMTTMAMKVSEKMTALGRLRRGSCTSSAMAPALSKPTNEKPTKAIATRNGPDRDR